MPRPAASLDSGSFLEEERLNPSGQRPAMSIAQQKRLLYLITAGCLLLGGIAAYWSLDDIQTTVSPKASRAAGKIPSALPEASQSANPRAELPSKLRGPLYDPPPPPPAPPVRPRPRPQPAPRTPKPRLQLTLVGTIIDAQQRFAIVADATGEFDVKGVGEDLDLQPSGIRIERIDAEKVTLNFQGTPSTIEIDRNPKPANGNANGKRNRRRVP